MIESIFDTCSYSIDSIKNLYIANRQLNGKPIEFPIDFLTITGTRESVVRVDSWDNEANIAVMGGQTIEWREVPNMGTNIEFNEEYEEGKQGQTYVKNLSFQLPHVNYNTNAALKEFFFSSEGNFAISNAIAFIIDTNNQKWIVGYDIPLILQDGMELSISEDNQYNLVYKNISYSRSRNYQIIIEQ
jgi:hypothetical protein